MRKALVVVALFAALLSGCVMNTMVTIDSQPQGAEVFIDGKPVGETPTQTRLSNAAWEDPIVRLTKEGHRTVVDDLDKEIKIFNGIVGFFWWPTWLWVWGPDNIQYYYLAEEE
jgi:hypothetical protein